MASVSACLRWRRGALDRWLKLSSGSLPPCMSCRWMNESLPSSPQSVSCPAVSYQTASPLTHPLYPHSFYSAISLPSSDTRAQQYQQALRRSVIFLWVDSWSDKKYHPTTCSTIGMRVESASGGTHIYRTGSTLTPTYTTQHGQHPHEQTPAITVHLRLLYYPGGDVHTANINRMNDICYHVGFYGVLIACQSYICLLAVPFSSENC